MRIATSFVTLALLTSPVAAQKLQPTKKDIEEIATTQIYLTYPEGRIKAFEEDLRQAILHRTPVAAADALAGKYGLVAADLRRFVAAWTIIHARRFDSDKSWVPPVRTELYALTPKLRTTPLGLAMLAEALDATGDQCPAAHFRILMQGSVDPAADAYTIASTTSCAGDFARATVAAGARAMPVLIRSAESGNLPPRDVLPIYAWLTSPAALAHIREADRLALSTILWRRYIAALDSAGFGARALAAFDGLPPDLRAAIIAPRLRPQVQGVIDGIAMTFVTEEGAGAAVEDMDALADSLSAQADALADEMSAKPAKAKAVGKSAPAKPAAPQPELVDYSRIEAPILQLAEAMTLAGREEEARELLATLPGLAGARAALACEYAQAGDERTKCPDSRKVPMGALPLDHLLNHPSEDPYPIAEVTLSSFYISGNGVGGALLCRVFPEADFPEVCPATMDDSYFTETGSTPEDVAENEGALEKVIPDFRALRASILDMHDVPAKPGGRFTSRATVAAMSPDFAEAPIPAGIRRPTAPVAIKGLAPLPDGFEPVRVERDGQRVVAISVSQTYDPTGEVSQGGYWVHLSEDGGKHWERPLYTGLADRFPYVVLSSSNLPLIAGDTLQLAVDVAEIDTASISYPPVGLRMRRSAKGRYLTIPLAELRKDSDGDGLTDLAAHHLLLDRPRSVGTTPFVLGSDYDADCRAAPSPEKLALVDLLGRVTGGSGAAIVEPVDRPAGQIMVGWRRAAAAGDQPVFLLGHPQDYACLTSKRLIIVYDRADIEAIQRFTPDFHALEMPRITFNRAHDRGYVRWSTGWTGGTYLLRRVNDKWVFASISSWIT